jgi:hypothetical protein
MYAADMQAHSQDGSKESVNFAAKTLKQLHTGAPRSLALTVEHFTHAYRLAKDGEPAASADGCLTREFNVRNSTLLAGVLCVMVMWPLLHSRSGLADGSDK